MATSYLILMLGLVAVVLALVQIRDAHQDSCLFPAPGRLVDLGGRRLHARVMGAGAPTVVFEAGISATSISWTALQPRIAQLTTTVSYDRAGLGWSDPSREPFDVELLLTDFTSLLERLKPPQPYVLVGHSYGALLVRIFAERNPEKVAGMVLLDPVLACEWAHPALKERRMLRAARLFSTWGALLARFGVVRFATAPLLRGSTRVPKLINKASAGPASVVVDRLAGEIRKLPKETWPIVRAHWCRPSNFRAMVKHLKALPGSFQALRNARFDCPLVVISGANISPQGLAEHQSIAALSSKGEHIMASAGGHWVHLDAVDLVEATIRRIVTSKMAV